MYKMLQVMNLRAFGRKEEGAVLYTPWWGRRGGRKWGADSGGKGGSLVKFARSREAQLRYTPHTRASGPGCLGKWGQGFNCPPAWPSPLGPSARGRRRRRRARPPCSHANRGLHSTPLRQAGRLSLCLLKLFSFRTGRRRGAGGRSHLLWNLREGLFINVQGSGFLRS